MTTLYIIHGWTYSVAPWQKTIELLEQKYHLKVVMLKVPGLTAKSDKVWQISDYVRWANDNLPDHCIALGHSNGGRILLNLAIKYPRKISHLILLDSAGIYRQSSRTIILKTLTKILSPLKNFSLLRKIFHKIIRAHDYGNAPENMKKTLSNMLESDKNLHPEKIIVKTSIIWGKNDSITPLSDGELLNQKIKGSSLRILENSKHAPYIDNPEKLAYTINEVIKNK